MIPTKENESGGTERWQMIRDLGILQVKLIVDGMRDLILVPASLIAGLISLISGKNGRPGPHFYRLLAWGKESELWINLFGAMKNSPEDIEQPRSFASGDIDSLVQHLEDMVVDEVKRGGVTTQAKQRLDKILDAMQRK